MYYYKEVMSKKLKERDEKINANIRFYHNKLGNSKGYKLYDIEYGDSTYEPIAKPKSSAYVVSSDEANRIKSSKPAPYQAKHLKENAKRFRKNNKKNNKKQKNKKKKGLITSITALILAGVMTVTGFFIASKLKKKDTGSNGISTSTSQKVDDLGTGNLDLLGEELPQEKKNSEYTKVSGDFNVEDVVVGADGRLYVDEESARNAAKDGTVEIDTKGGSLVVADDGTVHTREQGYEIVDESGNVIESGDGTPSLEEEGTDYVECPCDYYDDAGNLVHSKGEFITPAELELCKQYYHTTKPQGDEYAVVEEEIIYDEDYTTTGSNDSESVGSSETTTEEEVSTEEEITEEDTTTEEVSTEEETVEQEEEYSQNSSEGVTNADGTYTIYGVTYLSYADYQQYIIDGGAGYGYIDGIIQPIGDYEIENQYTI